jgi:hypothetical protein
VFKLGEQPVTRILTKTFKNAGLIPDRRNERESLSQPQPVQTVHAV